MAISFYDKLKINNKTTLSYKNDKNKNVIIIFSKLLKNKIHINNNNNILSYDLSFDNNNNFVFINMQKKCFVINKSLTKIMFKSMVNGVVEKKVFNINTD